LQIDAENALERTNKKFIRRFIQMEAEARRQSNNLDEMSLEEMDALWNAIKQQQHS
jgi:XTP/dITP diphosphohydrolase